MPGFGGPYLYWVDLPTAAVVLDLRINPWAILGSHFGLDRNDYDAGGLEHELIWSLSRVLASPGYQWAVLSVVHPSGPHDEWLYLGNSELSVRRLP